MKLKIGENNCVCLKKSRLAGKKTAYGDGVFPRALPAALAAALILSAAACDFSGFFGSDSADGKPAATATGTTAAAISSTAAAASTTTAAATEAVSMRYAAAKPTEQNKAGRETAEKPGDAVTGDITAKADVPTNAVTGDISENADVPTNAVTFEIAYISDSGLIGDGSITQATWDGVKRSASENGVGIRHYYPSNLSVGAFLEAIGRAAEDGARLVVASGVLSEIPVWTAHIKYPGIKFILVDGIPHNDDYSDETLHENLTVARFNSSEAGFLAGYAAVISGLRSLGFIGAMPSPEIADTGIGFIQGAEYAANELRLPDGSVSLRYKYYGTFLADSGAQVLALDWYKGDYGGDGDSMTGTGADGGAVTGDEAEGGTGADGEEGIGAPDAGVGLIYAAGGEMENEVAFAASLAEKQAIIYDNPAAGNILAAAEVEKNYSDAVYDCVQKYYGGKFSGGEFVMYGTAAGCVGLRFTDGDPLIGEADYARITALLASGAVKIIRANSYPYLPPAIDGIPVRAVNVIIDG